MRFEKYHQKTINVSQIKAISDIHKYGLDHITLVERLDGKFLTEKKGKSVSYSSLNIVMLYKTCLSRLYSVESDKWTGGIYSYWEVISEKGNDYWDFILLQVEYIVEKAKLRPDPLIQQWIASIKEYINDNPESPQKFQLLHGDLYLGNILLYRRQYRLIDFEYLHFGSKMLELTFLLFWDAISETDLENRNKRLVEVPKKIKKLKQAGIIDKIDEEQIFRLYLPLISVYAYCECELGELAFGEERKKGITRFWMSEINMIENVFL